MRGVNPGVVIGSAFEPVFSDLFDHPEPCFDLSPIPSDGELQAYYSFLNTKFIYQLSHPLPFASVIREPIEEEDVIGRATYYCGFPFDARFKQRLQGRIPEKIVVDSSEDDLEMIKCILHHEAIHVYCVFYHGDYEHASLWHDIAEKTGYKKAENEIHLEPDLLPGQFVEWL